MKEKNTLLKITIYFKGCPYKMTPSSPIYREYHGKNASAKTPFHEKTCQNHFKNKLPILITETQAKIITRFNCNIINKTS